MQRNSKYITAEGKEYVMGRLEGMEGTWQQKCDAIKEEVYRKFGYVFENGEALRSFVRRIESLQDKIKEISDAIPEERMWEVRDGHYFIEAGDRVFKLSIQDADELFADFSKHGSDLSWQRIRQKYGMSAKAWNHIKSKLELYKDSHVFSPHTAETLPEEELDERIEEVMGKHFDDRVVNRMVVTGEKMFKKEANRAMRFLYNAEYRLEAVKNAISNTPSLEYVAPSVRVDNPDSVTFAFADIHFGSRNHNLIKERFEIIVQDSINCPEGQVNWLVDGDAFEFLGQGEMHAGSRQFDMSTEFENGFHLLMDVVKTFADGIKRVEQSGKRVSFFFMPWNHDRMTPKNEDDKIRMGGLVFGEMLKMALSNYEAKIDYATEKIATLDYGSVRFIVHHGDGAFQKRQPDLIVNKFGDRGKYHVIVSADKHNVQQKEGFNYTWLILPAMKWEGEYDKDLFLYSEPWYVKVRENQWWTVDVEVKRLPK